ncbi:IclR family transcriptional regulator [Halarchaeum salinum]|uniref:IclR family transcriptional regulator n=1 Tax=Halarchaeum salinum TaxID=489912 RepID=A0AAV3S8C3_9EURY
MANGKRTYETTETSFEVIHAIERTGGATFTGLRSELNLPKSTLYYHLNTLEGLGYVAKENGAYQLGLRFLSHAENAKRKEPAYDIVRSKARDLADRMPEEIDFSTEENGRLVVVYHNIGGSAMTDFKIGQYLYMHTTADGKVLLSEMDEERVDEIIDQWGLPQLTENTITDRTELKAELDEIRERGYAINNEEHYDGLRSVGATITKPDGSVLGALAIDGATYRLTDQQIHDHAVDRLFETIDQIESEFKDE